MLAGLGGVFALISADGGWAPVSAGRKSLLRLGVVLLVVNFLAELILLAVDLGFFLFCPPSAVLAVASDFLVQLGLLPFDAPGFARRQGSVLHSLGDASLRILVALWTPTCSVVSR